ncbi:conjugal transfer protein TraF [Colwellia sp. MEBiC06753]
MDKVKISLLMLSIFTASSGAESYSAKRMGKGFTSVTKDFTSLISNPALLQRYQKEDDLSFSLNIGAALSDEYEVVDKGENIADNLDELDDAIDNISDVPPEELLEYIAALEGSVDEILDDLNGIEGNPFEGRAGINGFISLPNEVISSAIFVNAYGRIGGLIDYVETDEQVLREAIDNRELDLNDLQSYALAIGYNVLDIGLAISHQFELADDTQLDVGVNLKSQRIDLFYNSISIADFDKDEFDIFGEDNLHDDTAFNLDLGAHITFGEHQNWHAGLVVYNVMGHDINFKTQSLNFGLDPSAVAGLSYEGSWYTLSGEIDLIDRDEFASLDGSKYVSVGAEFRAGRHAQLRTGYRKDFNDVEGDIFTLGVGISPFDTVFVDIGGYKGDNDLYGVALHLGFKI